MNYATVGLIATREGSKESTRWHMALDPQGGTVLDADDRMLGRFPWFVLAQCYFHSQQKGTLLTIRSKHKGAWWNCVPDDAGAKMLEKYVPHVCHEFGPMAQRQMKRRAIWSTLFGLILSALSLAAFMFQILGISHSDPDFRSYMIRTLMLVIGLLLLAFGFLSMGATARIRMVLDMALRDSAKDLP